MARGQKAQPPVEVAPVGTESEADAIESATAVETEAAADSILGAVAQLTAESRAAVKAGDQALHAVLENALMALHTLRMRLVDVELDGAVSKIKALL